MMANREKALWVILAFVGVLIFNWQFVYVRDLAQIKDVMDILPLWKSYRATPDFIDSLKWLNGNWILPQIPCWRPLTSICYWLELRVIDRHGFFWSGCFGALLFSITVTQCVFLTWRLTHSRWCLAVSLAVAASIRFWNREQGSWDWWLGLFSFHQDLAVTACLLGATLAFDDWCQKWRAVFLGWTWFFFLLGCGFKETAYLFPLLAGVLAWGRSKDSSLSPLSQTFLLALASGVLWLYRARIIPNAYGIQEFRLETYARRALQLFSEPMGDLLSTGQLWLPGLALLLAGLLALTSFSRRAQSRRWWFLCFFLVGLYISLCYGLFNALYYFFDSAWGRWQLWNLVRMTGAFWAVWLAWKYRGEKPTLVALGLTVLMMAPAVGFYYHWHYTLCGRMFWSVFAGAVAPLMWQEIQIWRGKDKSAEDTPFLLSPLRMNR